MVGYAENCLLFYSDYIIKWRNSFYKEVFEEDYTHDANGNPTLVTSLFARRIDIADKGWRKRNNGHPILVLHSCASSTFAQEISVSKEFKGVIIIAPDVTLHTTKEKGEWLNSLVYGKHYEKKRSGLWHVYMNGSPLKDAAGKEIIYGAKAQPGTRGFDYRLNTKKK